MTDCQTVTQYRSQLAGLALPYQFDVSSSSVQAWDEFLPVAANAVIRPSDANQTGFVLKNGATAGMTGALEPAWPNTAGGTVTDGSVTWTAAAPPAAGQDTIASATWTQVTPPDATLTISAPTNSSLVSSAIVGGGTSGNVYTIKILVTMTSGAIYGGELILTIL